MTDQTTDVRPGQIWADNDWRAKGRTLRIDALEDDKAVAYTLTESDLAGEAREQCPHADRTYAHDCRGNDGRSRWVPKDTRGKTTRIALKRFRATSTGYRLITDVTL